MNTMVFLSVLR